MASTMDITDNQEPGFITITRNYNPDFDRTAFLSTLGLDVLDTNINPEKIHAVQNISNTDAVNPPVDIGPVDTNTTNKTNTTNTTRKAKAPNPEPSAIKTGTRRLKVVKPLYSEIPDPSTQLIPANSYFMNNRNIFTKSIMDMFGKKALTSIDKTPVSCEQTNEEFSLMTHQKIVREYLQTFSPYRGLLLFHGLGSGKTCSAIAIAEGSKHTKRVIIMSPASLHTNFYEELKKCGDLMYRQKNHWVFKELTNTNSAELEKTLSLSKDVILKQKGIWVCDFKKPSNFDSLSDKDKDTVTNQIDEMIKSKYQFIHYNGLREKDIIKYFGKDNNLLDNAVVIVDEAHNLISRIVNKITIKKKTISSVIYNKLMTAVNSKIILLTGTPMIN